MKNIYKPEFVENLFDEMSKSYTKMNQITSFGFSERWRKKFVNELEINGNSIVVDLMSGMGECWPYVFKQSSKVKLIGIDFSSQMVNMAKLTESKLANSNISILKENVLNNSLKENSVDFVISGFGLKTFNEEQLITLAYEINRILKPNGKFSLIDVSVPNNKILRFFYMFYLKKIIPKLGKLFLGNPETYKMLGIYTQKFKNSKHVVKIFANQGLQVNYLEYFYGCASGVKGIKN